MISNCVVASYITPNLRFVLCTGKMEVLLSLFGDSRASGIRKSHLAVRFLQLFSPICLKKKLVNFDDFFTSFLKSF